MNETKVLEAYSRLKGLRQNVPNGDVNTSFVKEFHEILSELEQASNVSLNKFQIPSSEIQPVLTGISGTGERHYSSIPFCDHNFFLMKVDGVLTMFELLMTGNKKQIGFNPE